MHLSNLLKDDDAVSPVIGVILMVAITVILAAVIGTFVLGLGDQVSQSQPSASVSFNYSNIGTGTASDDALGITHEGGDKLDQNNLNISVGGSVIWTNGEINPDTNVQGQFSHHGWNSSSITAGNKQVFSEISGEDVFDNGDTVRVIWSADNGDTAIIAEGEVN